MGWRNHEFGDATVDIKTLRGKPVRVQSEKEIPARTEMRIDGAVFVTGAGEEHYYGWTAPLLAREDVPPVKAKPKGKVKGDG